MVGTDTNTIMDGVATIEVENKVVEAWAYLIKSLWCLKLDEEEGNKGHYIDLKEYLLK